MFSECLLNLSFETETGVCQKQISFFLIFFLKKALVHQGKGAVRAAGRVGSFRGMAGAKETYVYMYIQKMPIHMQKRPMYVHKRP